MLVRAKIILLMCFISLFVTGCHTTNFDTWWPRTIQKAAPTVPALLSNIAIMLPLEGKGELAITSQAILNGILSAYYSSHQQSSIHLQIIDTSSGDLNALYREAIANGANIIIGPLTKPEVESIANMNQLSVPTIALNTLDHYQYRVVNNLYQFGLSPQDEVMQAAERMIQNQLRNVAVVVPENTWGNKIGVAFDNYYRSYGGNVVATLKYGVGPNLAEQVCNFLAHDATKLCGVQKRKNKKPKNPHEIMRRQDIDSIFVVAATPAQARQIVPLLKFYYASDLPIYSISTVYDGAQKPDLDQDINDVYFCDMPWVIESPTMLNPELQAIYKQIIVTTYTKFYALGIDAYNLAVRLNTLLEAPQVGVQGASGVLYLDKYNHIYRALQWAQMKNGVLHSLR